MIDPYFLVLTAIIIFVLSFMCWMVKLSETLAPRQAGGFTATFILVGGISVLELISVLVNDGPLWLRWLNILSNYLGFGLTPAVPILLVYTLQRSDRIPRSLTMAAVIELIYMVILTVSLFSDGFIFSVDEANHYSRQSGFNLYLFMHYLSIAYLTFSSLEMARNFQSRGRELIYAITGFLVIGTLVQVLNPQLHITWLCVTLITMLYFIYCSEMWNQLDGLTGLLSQKSYLNRTMNMQDDDRMLIVFDVDNFKHINDTAGHLTGDRCLKEIAECLKQAYNRHGRCYRIGGDEFCVLMRSPDKEAICKEKFLQLMERRRKLIRILPTVSYGSVWLLKHESIVDAKMRADQNMYEDKERRKAEARRG